MLDITNCGSRWHSNQEVVPSRLLNHKLKRHLDIRRSDVLVPKCPQLCCYVLGRVPRVNKMTQLILNTPTDVHLCNLLPSFVCGCGSVACWLATAVRRAANFPRTSGNLLQMTRCFGTWCQFMVCNGTLACRGVTFSASLRGESRGFRKHKPHRLRGVSRCSRPVHLPDPRRSCTALHSCPRIPTFPESCNHQPCGQGLNCHPGLSLYRCC